MIKLTVFNQSGEVRKTDKLNWLQSDLKTGTINEHINCMFSGFVVITEVYIGTDYVKVWTK